MRPWRAAVARAAAWFGVVSAAAQWCGSEATAGTSGTNDVRTP